MEYKIITIEQRDETVYTTVEYIIEGKTLEVVIPHFSPQTKTDVLLGIENRAKSEKRKLEVIAKNALVLSDLETEINKKVVIAAPAGK